MSLATLDGNLREHAEESVGKWDSVSLTTLDRVARECFGAVAMTDPTSSEGGRDLELHQIERPSESIRLVDAAAEARLAASIATHGQLSPVLVSRRSESSFALIDGYRRVRVLSRLGRDVVSAVALPMSEPAAMVFAHRLASGRRTCALEEAWLLRELRDVHRQTPMMLAEQFARSPAWISRRLALLDSLPESVQTHVQRGAICAHAAMTFLVPLSRDNAADAERLADAAAVSKLSTRQVERLVLAWRLGDAEQRERLLADPLLYLRAHAAMVPARSTSAPDALVDALQALAALCWRARRCVTESVRADPHSLRFEKLQSGWHDAGVAFAALRKRFEEHTDAGSGHTHGDSAALG